MESNYRKKIGLARNLLKEHNEQVALVHGNSEFELDIDKVVSELVVAGGTTDYALSKCTWEDLQEIGVPKLLARQVADIFRSKVSAE